MWEPTYVILYREVKTSDECSNDDANSEAHDASTRRNSGVAATLPQLPMLSQFQCSMDEVLQLLRQLYILSSGSSSADPDQTLGSSNVLGLEMFHSSKITNKLVQQIQDPLILSANAMPEWCGELTSSCPMLFPFETRLLYFQCTAFGASRSIVWLQNQRDLVRIRGCAVFSSFCFLQWAS